VHRHPSATGACPTSTAWTEPSARPAPGHSANRERAGSTTNGPSPPAVDAVVASDADVVAFSRTSTSHRRDHRQGARAGGVPPARTTSGLVPAGVPRTFGDADAFCFYSASERTLVERMYRWRSVPDRARFGVAIRGHGPARRRAVGLGDRPYVVSVGRCRRAQGVQDAGVVLRHLHRSGHPGPLRSRSSGRSRWTIPPHPDIVVTGAVAESDKWDIMRDALVSVSPSALESFSLVGIEPGSSNCRSW